MRITWVLPALGSEKGRYMDNGSRVSSREPFEQSAESPLDSWKEIASYVKRDISTVQRWEKREGMPIHRHVHDKRGSVYAFSSELDAWLQSRGSRLSDDEKELTATPVETGDKKTGILQGRQWILVGGVAVIVMLAVTYVIDSSLAGDANQPKIKSLAVLPLINLSDEPDQQYLVDGLTDELTTDLATLGTLRVISRRSAVLYRDTPKPLPQIAKELNVDAVVTGSVERSDGRVRVRAQLVHARTDEVLWAGSYDRNLADVLRLENDVSQSIAHEVGIRLTSKAEQALEHKTTTNPEARDAYLRARYFLSKEDEEGARKCLQYFQEAITKDPRYAAAYVGLSACYGPAYSFGLASYSEATSKAKAAAMKAIELDDELAEGHTELAGTYFWAEWDFGAAEREFRRALELDPNSASAHGDYSFLLRDIGHMEQAVKEVERARELDPLSLERADDVGWQLLYARRYDQAGAQFRSVAEFSPSYRQAHWGLARLNELKGMYKEAISECLKIPALPNSDPSTIALFQRRCALYAKVYRASGSEPINRKWYESAGKEINDAINRDGDTYYVAALYAETGEAEKALDLLEKDYARHDSELLQLKVDPRLDNLRSHPRFQALLHRMNFPE